MARILAIDDEEFILEVLKALLQSDGHDVLTALDGIKALEMVNTTELDLVISDVRMIPMNGFDVLRKIHGTKPHLPVIMLTAYASQESVSEAQELGAAAFLTKPFTGDEVLNTIKNVLASRKMHDHTPTLNDVVKDYMAHTGLHNFYEAKIELADELYWLGQKHSRGNLITALNDALGRKDVPSGMIDDLLQFREITVRVKRLVAESAIEQKIDSSELLLQIAKKIVDAHVRNKGHDEITAEYATGLLGGQHGAFLPGDIEFFREYYDSWRHSSAGKASHSTAAKRSRSTDQGSGILDIDASLNKKEKEPTEVRKMIQDLCHNPIRSMQELKTMNDNISGTLAAGADISWRKVKKVVLDHMSLADVSLFFLPTEIEKFHHEGVTIDELQDLLKTLNVINGKEEVQSYLDGTVQGSQRKEFMAAFASRYFRKRFGMKWIPPPAPPRPLQEPPSSPIM